jgi:hypothetical protein
MNKTMNASGLLRRCHVNNGSLYFSLVTLAINAIFSSCPYVYEYLSLRCMVRDVAQ